MEVRIRIQTGANAWILIYKFMSRLNESTNDVILAILSSDIRWTSRIRRYWVKTLYVHHDLV